MLRRLHNDQPAAFAFTPANLAWAQAQIAKYPEGRQASAVIPLLWRAQEQEGWLSKPAIEEVARMLGMAYIRVLEVATFYFMFHLSPVGSVAHIQICGTTPCMLQGSEELLIWCQRNISAESHHASPDGRFSWEEVECLGACANAPVAQIGKDYYEDLSAESLARIVQGLAAGAVPRPGSQISRFASEPQGGVTTLTEYAGEGRMAHNASVELALSQGDTVKRINGTETPLRAPWLRRSPPEEPAPVPIEEAIVPTPGEGHAQDGTGNTIQEAEGQSLGRPDGVRFPGADGEATVAPEPKGPETGYVPAHGVAGPDAGGAQIAAAPLVPEVAPPLLLAPRGGKGDDLRRITGIGPRLEQALHDLGIWHYDQIASWGPGEVTWVNSRLGNFRGRIERDSWIGQARRLAEEGGQSWESAKTPGP